MSDGSSKAFWLPRLATVLAVLSCYGTTVLIGLLSLLGVSLAINERAWAGAISVFATLATIAIAVSYRRHRIVWPTMIAILGLALVLWAMFGSYSRGSEFFGFVLLVAATLWDWRAGASRGATVDDVSWIEAGDLADRLKRDPAPIVIDVRQPDEFYGELGHLRGARNIPLAEFQRRFAELTEFKKRELTLVCRTQMRSAQAVAILKGAGFRDVRVLRGGMEQWNRNNLPAENRAPKPQP